MRRPEASDKRAGSTGSKRRKVLLIVTGAVALLVVAVLLLSRGAMPLVDGQRLAGGRVTVVADGFIAAYIVDLDDGVALIDATMDADAEAIRAALARGDRDDQDIRAIFLTHGHGDHIAGARAFPEADVYALAADVDLVEGRRTAGNLPGKWREPEPTGIDVDRPLGDGDIVRLGGTDVEVFALPGHSRGSAAYLVHGVLFLGDSAGATSEGGITAAPPVFSWDRERNRQSLHALADRLRGREDEIQALAFGHQGPLRGPSALMAWHESNQ